MLPAFVFASPCFAVTDYLQGEDFDSMSGGGVERRLLC